MFTCNMKKESTEWFTLSTQLHVMLMMENMQQAIHKR